MITLESLLKVKLSPLIKSNNLYDFKNIKIIWENIDNSSNSELNYYFQSLALKYG